MKKRLNFYLVILILVISVVSTAHAEVSYTFTTIDVPSATSTYTFGINDFDNMVGTYTDSKGINHGFLYAGGNFTAINVPGSSYTWAYGTNDSGAIVGWHQNATGIHGFLYAGGSFTTIDVPGASSTQVFGINDSGVIVGAYNDPTGTHGFFDVGGSFTTINFPDATNTYALGINDPGAIVGWYEDPSGIHGFLYAGGSFTTIDVPGVINAMRLGGVNNSAAVAGAYQNATGTHGFLYSEGNFTTINVPGATETNAFGINDSDAIVGWYQDATGTHGFLATPAAAPPADTTPPTITGFSIPATSTSLTVPIITFTAIDPDDVSLFYMVTESPATPLASDWKWIGAPPASHTFTTPGTKTLYGWAKDPAGNVSTSKNASVTITLSADTFTKIDFPGSFNTEAYGINNFGAIVGFYVNFIPDHGNQGHGFLWEGGRFTSIDFPGDWETFTVADGINDFGNIVGWYMSGPASMGRGFFYTGGGFTPFDFPDAWETSIEGINDSGAVVGWYQGEGDPNNMIHGFLYEGGAISFDFPGGFGTQAHGINNSGAIVGYYDDSSDASGSRHGFLYEGGGFISIDFPGASSTEAFGINNSNDIVGSYTDSKGINHGFLYAGGNFTTIDFPFAHYTHAYGINDFGAIVGYYGDATGIHGFLLTPAETTCSTPGTPSNPSPSNGATGVSTSPTLSWSATSNTDSYDVYFGTSSYAPYVGNTTSTSYTPTGLNQGTTYYWKIVAKNDCGNSASGPVWSFTINHSGVIALQSPTNGTVFDSCILIPSHRPSFAWITAGTFKGFTILYSTSYSDFSTPISRAAISPQKNSWIPTMGSWKAIMGTSYNSGSVRDIYWKLVGTMADKTKVESEIGSFRIGDLQAVTVNTPSDAAVFSSTTPPTLSFNSNCNIKFLLQFSSLSDFSDARKIRGFTFTTRDPNIDTVITRTLTSLQWASVKKLIGTGTGYFRITAWDGINRKTISEVRSFIIR